jgi:hypothetical protein
MKRWAPALGIWVLGFGICFAQINMPDPSLIHGKALPAPELAPGTATVRVVREAVGNNVVGQDVRMTASGRTRTVKTDDQGRAEFTNLPVGAEARAAATVNGEELVSDPFTVPSAGGLRVILVAGLKQAAARAAKEAADAAAAPPVKGAVVFSPNSRVLLEFRDDALHVFYVFEVLNTARSRVDIGGPLIIDLPKGAAGATLLEGSTPAATVSGDRVTVTGPFAAGVTPLQVSFQLRYDQANLTVEQRWPVALEQLTVAVEKLGAVSISSPQFSTVGEVKADSGTPFLLASGPALAAGSTLTFELSNLPVHSSTPRLVALTLAGAIIAAGAWFAFAGTSKERAPRQRLVERRNVLLAELAALARRARESHPEHPPDEIRRTRLVAELEQIYGELDDSSSGPQGGGEDVAA